MTKASKREATVDVEAVEKGDPEEEKRREAQVVRLNRSTIVRLEGQSPAESSAQSQAQGQPTASEGGTKVTKGKESPPKSEGIKEKQENVYNQGRSKIAPRVGSRIGRPRTPT